MPPPPLPPGLFIVLVLKDVCYLSRIEIEDVITNMPAVPACTEKGSTFSQMLTVRLGGVTVRYTCFFYTFPKRFEKTHKF